MGYDMNWKERTYCGDLGPDDAGREVLLMGWVDAARDHGSLLFIHLRDVRGIVQVVFDPADGKEMFENAEQLRSEHVVQIRGKVALRAPGTENPNLKTGSVEVHAFELVRLAGSRTLPFPVSEKAMVFGEEIQSAPEHVDEDLRLRYRYLDLRRPSMQSYLLKRFEVYKVIRRILDEYGFIEVETPFLTRSTPEGARDYLVPSRIHAGSFYALPQSPQLFKQLLMMSGMDRYFQIARCFRDEDLRPNRQPEFTQLDLEASFIDETFIYEVVEELTLQMFEVGGIQLSRPFPRMTFHEAMDKYGTDRPDLRFGLAFEEVTDILRDTDYAVFRGIIDRGGVIKGFRVPGAAGLLSKNILQNEYALKLVPEFGGRGMTWMKMTDGRLRSNIVQFFREHELERLTARFQARDNDVIMMIADSDPHLVNEVLCRLRLHVAERLGLIPEGLYRPVWITDFPLFELKDGVLGSQHHPFTMPDRVDFDPDDRDDLVSLRSRAYDLVMNGEELGGGSIRIHSMDVQEKIFRALGLTPEDVENKFGFFLRALEYGAPPHGGLALGLDRVVAMILGTASIRDVMAFPKNRSALCPLTRAPSAGDPAQLNELHISLKTEIRGPGHHREQLRDTENGAPSKAGISRAEVDHVARLARLRLCDEEVEMFQRDLASVLDYAASLEEIDTNDVEPMSHALEMSNVWRDDEGILFSDQEEILSAAPDREEDLFKVPKIL
ncbi:MAG: aspartate--tRNA ligase [Thermodesulfobacteriota bacterium]